MSAVVGPPRTRRGKRIYRRNSDGIRFFFAYPGGNSAGCGYICRRIYTRIPAGKTSGYANKIAYPGIFPLGYAHPGGKTPQCAYPGGKTPTSSRREAVSVHLLFFPALFPCLAPCAQRRSAERRSKEACLCRRCRRGHQPRHNAFGHPAPARTPQNITHT